MTRPKKLKSVCLKFYHDCPNAGDQFSFALAKHYFSDKVISCGKEALTIPNLVLVGSYLHNADAYSHICGAGFLTAESPRSHLSAIPKSVHCVRGPLTAELLEKQGVFCPKIYADPGILASELYPRSIYPCHKIGIIPHFLDAHLPWIDACRKGGIPIIDVCSSLDRYFAEIHQCEVILSSSLHGLIFAHTYGIPALWIELSGNVIGDGFKFYDYYLSLGVKPETVKRIRITEGTDPNEISKLATAEDQTKLVAPLKEAMLNTIEELRRDQFKTRIKNVLMPWSLHNRKKIVQKVKKILKHPVQR